MLSPRAVCGRCKRPSSVCYCAALAEIPTQTKVVLLQHPREHGNAIGTAWMAKLCLPNAALHVGIEFDGNPAVRAALANPEAPAVLLYPGEHATNILAAPPKGPVTLVVVDGTWRQARSVMHRNPALAALPRYAFAAPRPSEYRIRKEPSDEVVSTIESLMYALGAIEGHPERFTALLAPFRAMVETQLGFSNGKRRRRKLRTPKIIPPSEELQLVRARWADLVCIMGEANAWPYAEGRHKERDELAHWVAVRPSTGEVFEALAEPQHGWSPSATRTMQLDMAALGTAQPAAQLYERFAAFMRPTDILGAWSWYGPRLYGYAGHALPVPVVDMRKLIEEVTRTRVPRLETYAVSYGLPLAQGKGRAWQRLQILQAVARHCARPDENK